MARKGPHKAKSPIGDPNDPQGLGAWAVRYLEALRVRNFSDRTIVTCASHLRLFAEWCEARSLARPQEITKPILERYQRHMFHVRKPSGKPLSFATQAKRLCSVRAYFKWLTRQNVLLWNPASEIELPRVEKRLPRHVLTADEAARVLDQPNVAEPIGLRDRAMLETLYSTGIRRMELANLAVSDVDVERGMLMVRQGKGKTDRMVPIGEQATMWVEKYLNEARPRLVMPPDTAVLFLTQHGDSFCADYLTILVRDYVAAADIGKRGACHLFRHTCATLMHEGGADIRILQEMLGHARLDSTQIYTRVAIRRLKLVHSLTHPSAKIDRPKKQDATTLPGSIGGDEVENIIHLVAHSAESPPTTHNVDVAPAAGQDEGTEVAAQQLMAALDAEVEEDEEMS